MTRTTGADDPHGTGRDGSTVELRARGGRLLAWVVIGLCAAAWVVTLVQSPAHGLRWAPALALPALVVWLVLARPAVVVSDGGVELRNVLRTVHLPWTAIRRIDTKYALTLETAYGTYAAWAAPAPSRVQTLDASPADLEHLPESTYVGGARPGDLISSPSGRAAAQVRRRWEALRDAGALDEPRLEHSRPVVRWHVLEGLAVAGLVVLAAVATRL